MKKIKHFFRNLFPLEKRYDYKVVYTQIILETHTKRWMCKLKFDADNMDILLNLPDYANNGYTPPFIKYHTNCNKNLNKRLCLDTDADTRSFYMKHYEEENTLVVK